MAFNLAAIQKGREQLPPRMVVHGVQGIGKSTFGASAPGAIFFQLEKGLRGLDVEKFPHMTKYGEVVEAIGTLYNEPHEYKTLVIDSIDWLEPVIWDETITRFGHMVKNQVNAIEDFGFGKGYTYALDVWRELLDGLDALCEDKGMAIILIAHTIVKRFDDPTTEPYDRYKIKLNEKAQSKILEWGDVVGFAHAPAVSKSTDVGFSKEVRRGLGMGERKLYLQESPAFVAKNRYSLPESVPLSWSAFIDALTQSMEKKENG